MKNLIFITLLFAISFVSCERECNENLFTSNSDYLIFGHFYGECFGEKCIEIYKLDNTHLFEDTTDVYPITTNFYDGSYVQLSQQKFESSRDIMNYFPSDLLNEPNIVIGQPDAADGGGLYVEFNFDGVRKIWLIDQQKSNVPTKYHSFMDELNKRIYING